ncbi:unnamed protein product [Closterium sp. NIES-54]
MSISQPCPGARVKHSALVHLQLLPCAFSLVSCALGAVCWSLVPKQDGEQCHQTYEHISTMPRCSCEAFCTGAFAAVALRHSQKTFCPASRTGAFAAVALCFSLVSCARGAVCCSFVPKEDGEQHSQVDVHCARIAGSSLVVVLCVLLCCSRHVASQLEARTSGEQASATPVFLFLSVSPSAQVDVHGTHCWCPFVGCGSPPVSSCAALFMWTAGG